MRHPQTPQFSQAENTRSREPVTQRGLIWLGQELTRTSGERVTVLGSTLRGRTPGDPGAQQLPAPRTVALTFGKLKTFSARQSTWEGKIPIPATPARLLAQSWTVAMTSKGKQLAGGRRRWEWSPRAGQGETGFSPSWCCSYLTLGWGSRASQSCKGTIGGNHFGSLPPLCRT